MLKKYIENEKLRSLVEWIIAIVLAFICYLFISNYVYGTAEISGPSMNPTLYHGERVFINKFTYLFTQPKKNDIVAFPFPGNPQEKYIKRVIGVPGDQIDIIENEFYVNGQLLEDDFSYDELVAMGDVAFPITVPEGRYFVLGDNRNNSRDSRYEVVGCIKKEDMIGRVSIRIMPFNKFGKIN